MNAIYRAVSIFLALAGLAIVASVLWTGTPPPGGDTGAAATAPAPGKAGSAGPGKKSRIEIINGGPKVVGVQVGNRALEITGETIDGEPLALSDFKGKVVLLDFWGNW